MIGCSELAFRFVTSGSLIVLISLMAKTKYPILSGLFVLFPAVSLIGYYYMGQSVSISELQHVTKYSILGLSATFIFLVVFYYAQEKQTVNHALISATFSWLIAAGILLKIKI